MNETNGVTDPDSKELMLQVRAGNLDDWWIIDALDGRRWLGRFTHTDVGEVPLPDEMKLQPALEVCPDKAVNTLLVPQMQLNPRTMQQELVPSAQHVVAVVPFQVSLICNFAKNDFPPVYVRYAARIPIREWTAEARKALGGLIFKMMEEVARSMRPEPSFDQSREKVR